MSSTFPANYVLGSYVATESMLVDFLQFVPYCKDHLNVWSPKLVTILLETCSQLDSLWRYQAKKSPFVANRDFNIRNYFNYFGENIAPKWVVLWGDEPEQIFAFDEWRNKKHYNDQSYTDLDWWLAHNKLKHDRLANRSEATLCRATRAIAGLFLAILRLEECREAAAYLWMTQNDHPYPAFLDDESSSGTSSDVTVDTKLFNLCPILGKGIHSIKRDLGRSQFSISFLAGKRGKSSSRRCSLASMIYLKLTKSPKPPVHSRTSPLRHTKQPQSLRLFLSRCQLNHHSVLFATCFR